MEHVYIGGELGPDDWPALRREGVSVVINLQEEQQDIFEPHEQVEGYLWLPAPDGLSPSLEQLILGVDFIRSCVASDQRIFVHCKAGQGRAPLLCACYLISEGDSVMSAMAKVRAARRQTLLTPEQGVSLRLFAAAYGERKQEPTEAKYSGSAPELPHVPEAGEVQHSGAGSQEPGA
jgi:atypical dual specificity phosphatase